MNANNNQLIEAPGLQQLLQNAKNIIAVKTALLLRIQLGQPEEGDPAFEVAQAELAQATTAAKQFQDAIKVLEGQSPQLKQKQDVRKHVAEAVKTFGQTRYKGTPEESAREFWEEFKTFMINQNYEPQEIDTYSIPILKALVRAPNSAIWFKQSVQPKFDSNNPVTMEALEKIFLDDWIDSITKSMEETELHSFAWGNESAITFQNRMSALYVRFNINTETSKNEQPGMANLISELYTRLPNSVRASTVIQKTVEEYDNLQELLMDIRGYPEIPTDIKLAGHVCFYCSGKTTWSCVAKCHSFRALGKGKNTKMETSTNSCPKHPNSSHSSEECRSQKRKPSDTGNDALKGDAEKRQRLRDQGKCFKCEKPWSKEHACEQFRKMKATKGGKLGVGKLRVDTRKTKKLTHNFQKLKLSDESYDKALEEVEEYFCKTHAETPNDHLIRIPLTINSIKVLAVLDTYATLSVLDPTLVSDLNLPLDEEYAGTKIKLGDGSTFTSSKRTKSTNVQMGSNAADASFEVIPMGSRNRAVIGMDLYRKFGLQVLNIPPSWPKKEVQVKPVSGDVNKASGFYLRFQNEILPLLRENESIKRPCSHPAAVIRFETSGKDPVNVRQYPVPFRHHETIDVQIKKWVEESHIEENSMLANVEWNLPLLVVPKKNLDGSIKGWRVCLDPRQVNLKLKKSAFPIPLIETILSKLREATIFSKIDLRQGFHQFVVQKEDRVKTSFTWKGKRYQFKVAPFGFANIPNEFQRVVSMIIAEGHSDYAVVYIDDIIIFSNTPEEHLKHVKAIITTLNKYHLRIQVEKLLLGENRVEVLGNICSSEGTRVALEKLVAIEGWKKPERGLMIQKQLGFFNYFRNLIPGYAKIVAPLEKLRNQETIIWSDDYQAIYDKLITIMKSDLVLKNPNFSQPFYLATDASKYGIGGVLYQKETSEPGKKWTPRFIKFVSRCLHGAEINYGATKRELLAIVWSIEKLRDYLWGSRFTVETDHNALTFMFTQKKINSTIANWLETLLDFDFDVVHCPGIQHVLPDAISRFYDNDDPEILNQEHAFFSNESCNQSIEREDRVLENVLDTEARKTLVERAHLMGHFGANAMVKAIHNDGYSWAGIRDQCQTTVARCVPCQKFNIGKHGYHPMKNLKALMPFDHVTIDLKEMPRSDRNNNYYLLVIDVATRFVFLRPLVNKEMTTVAQELLKLFCDVGFPLIITMDNGAEFVNQVMAQVVEISKMDRRLFTPYHHRGNGMAERAIRTSSEGIYKQLEGRDQDWDLYLPAMQLFMNLKETEVKGASPYSLMYARAPNKFMDNSKSVDDLVPDKDQLLTRLEEMTKIVYPAIKVKSDKVLAKRNAAFERNNQIKYDNFPDGACVWVRDENRQAKAEPRYEGPFTVIRRNKGGVYVLKGTDGSEYTRPGHVLKLGNPETWVSQQSEPTRAVKKILNHRLNKEGQQEYLVKWQETKEVDWVLHSDFNDHGPIRTYWKPKRKNKKVAFEESSTSKSNQHTEHASEQDLQTVTPAVIQENQIDQEESAGINPDDDNLPKDLQSDLAKHWQIPEGKRRRLNDIVYKE